MRCFLLLIITLVAGTGLAQEQQRRIGAIEFFGYSGLDLQKVRTNLPVKEGDSLSESDEAILQAIEKVKESVRLATGTPPTHAGVVCCDPEGSFTFFIGLPGKNLRNLRLNPKPRATLVLRPEMLKLYDEAIAASEKAIFSGIAGVEWKGYPVSTDPLLRSKQLATREVALKHGPLLRRVLTTARDSKEREAAAYFVGYAPQSRQQIAALVHASRDVNENVRNNAIRALAVMAENVPEVAAQIPAGGFIDMLNSGSWTDRNKAGYVVEALTRSRSQRVLGPLRVRALDSLLEMARWRNPGHAYPGRVLLGRIAGIEEQRLNQLIAAGQVDQIIQALNLR